MSEENSERDKCVLLSSELVAFTVTYDVSS